MNIRLTYNRKVINVLLI